MYGKYVQMKPSYGITHLQINWNEDIYHQLDGRYIEHKGYTFHNSKTMTNDITNILAHSESLDESMAAEMKITGFDSYPVYGCAYNVPVIIKESCSWNITINNINYIMSCTPISIEDMGSISNLGLFLTYSEDHKIAILTNYDEDNNKTNLFLLTNYDLTSMTEQPSVILTATTSEDTIIPFDRKFIPIASSSEIGGIKVGNNLSIDYDGTLNASSSEVEVDYKTVYKNLQNQLRAIGKKGTGENAEIFNYWEDNSGTSDNNNVAAGNYSHAEGRQTAAIGRYSHAEGAGSTYNVKISGSGTTYSYTIDSDSLTPIPGDLIERYNRNNYTRILTVDNQNQTFTTLSSISDTEISNESVSCFTLYTYGWCSHAEGSWTKAIGDCSHAGGDHTIAGYDNQTAIGKYNDNQENTLFEVGNGSQSSRSNAFEVHSDGRATVGADPTADMDVATKKYVDDNSGSYTLPVATSSTLGGIKVGNNLNINNGIVTVKPASSSILGGVKINYDSETQTLYMTTE